MLPFVRASGSRRARIVTALLLVGITAVPVSAPASAEPPRTHHLVVIGDSLTFGAEHFAKLRSRLVRTNRWRSVTMHAIVGMTIPDGIRALKKMKKRTPTTILVALGTNDVLSQRNRGYPAQAIDSFMTAAGDRPVLWMNVEFSTTRRDWRSRGGRFNTELRRARARWSNLQVSDWSTHFEPTGPSRFISDGIHLTISGYKTRANFIMSELKSWAATVDASVTTTTTLPAEQSPDEPTDPTTTIPATP